MKRNILRNTVIVAFALMAMTACGNDPAAPVVTLNEVEHENSHSVVAGDDLHLEANIVAEGIVKSITLHVSDDKHASFVMDTAFVDSKYIGVRNVELHEHIDIPAMCVAGRYSLMLSVADREGQVTEAGDSFMVVEQ